MIAVGHMLRRRGAGSVLAALVTLAAPAIAVQPDEVLDDPVLEDRARDISAGLRCIVCRNESIDESSAELARDVRLLVRERLLAGDTDDEVIASSPTVTANSCCCARRRQGPILCFGWRPS